jgi:hypothetical protein
LPRSSTEPQLAARTPQPPARPDGAPSAVGIAARIERLPDGAAGAVASKHGALRLARDRAADTWVVAAIVD